MEDSHGAQIAVQEGQLSHWRCMSGFSMSSRDEGEKVEKRTILRAGVSTVIRWAFNMICKEITLHREQAIDSG